MEEKILSILLKMQEDIGGLKQTVGVMQEDIGDLKQTVGVMQKDINVLKENQTVMQEDIKNLKEAQDKMQKAQDKMQRAQDKMNIEIHEIKFELSGMKEVQEEILEELRISNLKQGQIIENLSRLEEENAKEHKEFDKRIRRLEAKAV